eukprot:1161469-Pelagomonas_calceolata.AAC.7
MAGAWRQAQLGKGNAHAFAENMTRRLALQSLHLSSCNMDIRSARYRNLGTMGARQWLRNSGAAED